MTAAVDAPTKRHVRLLWYGVLGPFGMVLRPDGLLLLQPR